MPNELYIILFDYYTLLCCNQERRAIKPSKAVEHSTEEDVAKVKLATGNNTNNFYEAAMSILKDRIPCCLKAFNLNQLVDFILTRLEHYYERRLMLPSFG